MPPVAKGQEPFETAVDTVGEAAQGTLPLQPPAEAEEHLAHNDQHAIGDDQGTKPRPQPCTGPEDGDTVEHLGENQRRRHVGDDHAQHEKRRTGQEEATVRAALVRRNSGGFRGSTPTPPRTRPSQSSTPRQPLVPGPKQGQSAGSEAASARPVCPS